MPPKKEKKDQFTGDQASELILDYLTKQNRPYSVIEISANLHNAVTKATATKVLKEMHESGQIEGRVSGKQIVYHAIQDPNDNASEDGLKALDEEAEKAKKETAALKLQLKEAQSSLSALKATPSMETLEESVGNLEAEVQELENTLATLRTSATKPADPEKKATAEAAYKSIEKVYLARKKQFKEFWAIICEVHDGKPAELWETLGLEEVTL